MREFIVCTQPLNELHQTLLTAGAGIARMLQDLRCQPVLQIPLQITRSVQIQQRALFRKPQRQEAEPLRDEHLIVSADLREQSLPAFIRAREQAAGLDPGQRRCTEPYNVFLRHGLPPRLWSFTGFRAVSNSARSWVKVI